MKKLINLLITILIVTLNATAQESGTCGEHVNWTLDTSGALTISGTGAMTDYYYAQISSPWSSNSASIKTVIIEEGVTHIGNDAFYNCRNLTSVTVPNSITEISSESFLLCDNLAEFILEVDNPSFCFLDGALFNKNMTTLFICLPRTEPYIVPEGVTSIVYYAFTCCTNLTAITLPKSVTDIDICAFAYCWRLSSVNIPDNVIKIGSHAFAFCPLLTITIPNGITNLAGRTFTNCTALTSITVLNLTPPEITESDFFLRPDSKLKRTLIVPSSAVSTYSSIEVWDSFTDIVGGGLLVAAQSENVSYGLVSGSRLSESGEQITLAATPHDGYRFVKWTKKGDESTVVSTDPVYNLTAFEDTELIAHFEPDRSSASVMLTAMAIDLYPNPVIEGFYVKGIEEEVQITITRSGGQMMMYLQQVTPGQYVDTSALSAGIYIVKIQTIGGYTYKKIIKG